MAVAPSLRFLPQLAFLLVTMEEGRLELKMFILSVVASGVERTLRTGWLQVGYLTRRDYSVVLIFMLLGFSLRRSVLCTRSQCHAGSMLRGCFSGS